MGSTASETHPTGWGRARGMPIWKKNKEGVIIIKEGVSHYFPPPCFVTSLIPPPHSFRKLQKKHEATHLDGLFPAPA